MKNKQDTIMECLYPEKTSPASSKIPRSPFLFLLLIAMLWMGGLSTANGQVVRSFTERAGFDQRGNIDMIGNVLLTCEPGGTPDCADVQAGTASSSNNRQMQYVNIDGGAGFANSSSAGLTLPAGASVLYAGLYWGGRADPSDTGRGTIQFRVAGSGSYTPVTADELDTITAQGTATSRPYQAFADVTSMVQAAGNGTYFAGGLTAGTGPTDGLGFYGGWSLIVIYQDDTEPFRRLSLFDGAVNISGTTSETVNISGLLTPSSGSFDTFMGALVWEGDESITGDQFLLEGTNLSNTLNPATNFWNSSITRLDTRISDKNPDYVNQLAVDLDYVDASGILTNGATTAEIVFSSTGDAYFPHALTFAVDLHVPDLVSSISKTANDLNGETLIPGDIIEYTITFNNDGEDGATNVVLTDPIPTGTTYVPGSLNIVQNAGGSTGSQSDGSGDDLAEFDIGNNEVIFRVGQGADASNGGLVSTGQIVELTFQVEVNPGTSGQTITNTATVTHNAETLTDLEFTGEDSAELEVDDVIEIDLTLTGGPCWRMLSSPIDGLTYSAMLNGLWTQGVPGSDYEPGPPNVFLWDNTVSGNTGGWTPPASLNNVIAPGTGFLVSVYADDDFDGIDDTFPKTITLSGLTHAGDVTPSMNTTSEGWTLVGNPYNEPVEFDALITNDLTDVAYIYDRNTGSWVSTTGGGFGDITDGVIAPGQGFFVQNIASPTSPLLTFTEASQSTGGEFYGKEKDRNDFARLEIRGQELYNSMWVRFSNDGSFEPTRGDALKLEPLAQEYALLGSRKVDGTLTDIGHYPVPNEEAVIPVSFQATQPGSYTITATDLDIPSEINLWFTDLQTSQSIRIDGGFEYTFTLGQAAKAAPDQNGITPCQAGPQMAKTSGNDRFIITTSAYVADSELPASVELGQNYPNPFNPSTVIRYELPAQAQVRLEVFDMAGRRVATLVEGSVQAGVHTVTFDASHLSSGVYLYSLQTDGVALTRKLTLIK